MSDSTVAVVRDVTGAIHFSSRTSQFVRDGLADGTLTDVEESREAPADAPNSDRADPQPAKRGPRNRPGNATASNDH